MPTENLSAGLVERLWAVDTGALPGPVRQMAAACLLDWLGVAMAGAGEPVVACLTSEAADREAGGRCAIVGRMQTTGPIDAARINGAASHALDYDDSLPAMRGHANVSVIPALLATAQQEHIDRLRLLDAIVIGHEAAGWLGAMLGPDHYLRGFHATATLGAMASALACARLMGLDAAQGVNALSLAATEAAGLRAMFGTMGKPFHAGLAAASGVLAARLAARGFIGTPHPLEHKQGFAAAHGSALQPVGTCADPPGSFHILGNLFKYNAACFGTQSAIAAAIALHEEAGLLPDRAKVTVDVAPELDGVCNIAWPDTGLAMKFSLRATVAMALRGVDMARPDAFSDAEAIGVNQQAMMRRVGIVLDSERRGSRAIVTLTTADGHAISREADLLRPDDAPTAYAKVAAKFHSLAAPMLGDECARSLAAYAALAEIDPAVLLAMTRPITALRAVRPAPAAPSPGVP